MNTKTCTFCNLELDLSLFPWSKRDGYGHSSRCNDCKNFLRRSKVKNMILVLSGDLQKITTHLNKKAILVVARMVRKRVKQERARLIEEQKAYPRYLEENNLKLCRVCRDEKDVSEFRTGTSVCKGCVSKAAKEKWANKSEEEKKAHKDKMVRYRRQRCKKRKKWLVELKGGECTCCHKKPTNSTMRDFHFHHVDPSAKEATVSQLIRHGREEDILYEVSKCILVCSKCHTYIHKDDHKKTQN